VVLTLKADFEEAEKYLNLALEKRLQVFLRDCIAAGLVASAHDLSDGGLAVAVAEGCIASGLGARLRLPAGAARLDHLLFAEGGARILVSVPAAAAAAWHQALQRAASAEGPLPAQPLGQVTAAAELVIDQDASTLVRLPVPELVASYEGAIPRRLGADLPPSA